MADMDQRYEKIRSKAAKIGIPDQYLPDKYLSQSRKELESKHIPALKELLGGINDFIKLYTSKRNEETLTKLDLIEKLQFDVSRYIKQCEAVILYNTLHQLYGDKNEAALVKLKEYANNKDTVRTLSILPIDELERAIAWLRECFKPQSKGIVQSGQSSPSTLEVPVLQGTEEPFNDSSIRLVSRNSLIFMQGHTISYCDSEKDRKAKKYTVSLPNSNAHSTKRQAGMMMAGFIWIQIKIHHLL